MRENAEILGLFREIFVTILPLIEILELSNHATKEISRWVYNSSITQIRQLKDTNLLLLRLICFVKDQYYLRQDYGIDAISKKIKTTINKARGYDRKQKEATHAGIIEANQVAVYSAKNANGVIRLIGKTSKDNTLALSERVEKVNNLVDNYFEAVDPDIDDHIGRLERQLESIAHNSDYYDYLFDSSNALVKSLSLLVKTIEFDKKSKNNALLQAIKAFKSSNFTVNESTPTTFLKNKNILAFEREDNIPNITKYKILLFSQIYESIKDRTLTLEYSYRYLADQHLWISDEEWQKNKQDHCCPV